MTVFDKLHSPTDLITIVFSIFGKNIKQLVIINLLTFAIMILLFVPLIIFFIISIYPHFNQIANQADMEMFFKSVLLSANMIIFFAAFFFLSVFLGVIKQGAVAKLLEQSALGRKISYLECFKTGADRSFAAVFTLLLLFALLFTVPFLIAAGGIYLIAAKVSVMAGVLLLIFDFFLYIAVFFYSVNYSMILPVVVLKGKSFMGALSYAKTLVKDLYLQTLGYSILFMLVLMAFSMVVNMVNYAIQIVLALVFGFAAESSPVLTFIGTAIMMLFSIALSMIPQAFADLPLVMLYLNREAFVGDGKTTYPNIPSATQQTQP